MHSNNNESDFDKQNDNGKKIEFHDGEHEKEFSNVLKVKADDRDISPYERKKKVKLLAGAIAHGLRQFGNVYVRCFSPASCFKASKAIAIARGYVAVQGFDLYNTCSFIEAEMGGKNKTGICYECFTNATDVNDKNEFEEQDQD
jgi:stage V sporulation protein S